MCDCEKILKAEMDKTSIKFISFEKTSIGIENGDPKGVAISYFFRRLGKDGILDPTECRGLLAASYCPMCGNEYK